MDELTIHEILARALLAGRIPAGTKLGEHQLAEVFGVSRERVRKVLHRLGHERLLNLVKNRGAFAIEPDPREARMVYEARRILEGGIVAHLCDHLTDAQAVRLREHMEAEEAALRAGDRATWIRLSGTFHLMLAEMTENAIIVRQAQELVGRTVMLVTFYEPDSASACGCDEHRSICRAVTARERSKAIKAMSSHLSLVETRLRPRPFSGPGVSLDVVLVEELEAHYARSGNAP
ncbi:GntR family transcriptional regulator [Azospirillum sp. RWY-5-1]|uniref:GntR family transcriptional regulator n=1 Tax=Azospirillum oleiclasticum TaxID=2735135 RepID=A0ABX2TE87_9PROT|nr:GntR family transcriptional regulator [Azospirillum oleiclasticum]NYZ22646.1 GntR family transcriptional regulator [Azospirillum oleiclasticum]